MRKNKNQSPLTSMSAEELESIRTGPHKDGLEMTPHEREEFSAGYRQGYPLEGEPLPPLASNPSDEYTRGYAWGVHDYVPGIQYEPPESELVEGIKGFFSRLWG